MNVRADVLLTEKGLAPSRERARALIIEGVVYFGEVKVSKPSDMLAEDAVLIVRENPIPYVSRGGLKLKKAVECYSIALTDRVCVDVGASTGGFTDCMLQNGAKLVYAVDVGYGQLDWKLRNDNRVVCLERHNARLMESEWFEQTPSFASVDVSFISVRLILPRLWEILDDQAETVVLVKPQFEAGRSKVGKNGVVRDINTHIEVLYGAAAFAAEQGFGIMGLNYSPITGPKGNIEYLMYAKKNVDSSIGDMLEAVKTAVSLSHGELM